MRLIQPPYRHGMPVALSCGMNDIALSVTGLLTSNRSLSARTITLAVLTFIAMC